MLAIIIKKCNKPSVENFNTLSRIMYDLTNLDYYSLGISVYYQSCAACGYTSFFEAYWQLRNEVKKVINL